MERPEPERPFELRVELPEPLREELVLRLLEETRLLFVLRLPVLLELPERPDDELLREPLLLPDPRLLPELLFLLFEVAICVWLKFDRRTNCNVRSAVHSSQLMLRTPQF